jgi:hypothetical protein
MEQGYSIIVSYSLLLATVLAIVLAAVLAILTVASGAATGADLWSGSRVRRLGCAEQTRKESSNSTGGRSWGRRRD